MKHFKVIPLVVLALATIPAIAVGQSLQNSRMSESQNGEYMFVERSDQNIDQLYKEVIKGWKRVGISQKEILRMSKVLSEDFEKERKLRKRFNSTGLYASKSGELVNRVDSFPGGIESVYVSDNGDFVIGLNSHIPFDLIGVDTPRSEMLKTPENALIAINFQGTPNRCVVSIPEMLGKQYPIERASEGFFWASKTANIDSERGTIEIEMGDLSKTVWDVRTCTRISPPVQSEEVEPRGSACFGFSVFVFAVCLASRSTMSRGGLTLGGRSVRRMTR